MAPAAEAAGLHPAGAGRRREGGQRLAGLGEIARPVQQLRRAAQRLHGGGLRHAAHPRRRAAAEGEEVLPGDEAPRAPRGGAVELGDQLGQAVATAARAAHARAVHQVGPLPVDQRLELHAAPGVVLEQDLAAAEAHLGARAGERARAPEARVAAHEQEHRGHAGGGQAAPERQALGHADHVVQLALARSAQAAQRAARAEVPAQVAARRGAGHLPRAARARDGTAHGTRTASADGAPRAHGCGGPAGGLGQAQVGPAWDERVGGARDARSVHHEDLAGGRLGGRDEGRAEQGGEHEAPATCGHLG